MFAPGYRSRRNPKPRRSARCAASRQGAVRAAGEGKITPNCVMLELGPFRDGVIFGSRPGCRAPEAGHAAAVAMRGVHRVAGRGADARIRDHRSLRMDGPCRTRCRFHAAGRCRSPDRGRRADQAVSVLLQIIDPQPRMRSNRKTNAACTPTAIRCEDGSVHPS